MQCDYTIPMLMGCFEVTHPSRQRLSILKIRTAALAVAVAMAMVVMLKAIIQRKKTRFLATVTQNVLAQARP
jgi:hypothetical protein